MRFGEKRRKSGFRSSTPREFARDFAGEESFNKALIRLEEGLSALDTMDEESEKVASVSFIEELENNFQFEIDLDELTILNIGDIFLEEEIFLHDFTTSWTASFGRGGQVSIN